MDILIGTTLDDAVPAVAVVIDRERDLSGWFGPDYFTWGVAGTDQTFGGYDARVKVWSARGFEIGRLSDGRLVWRADARDIAARKAAAEEVR